MKVSISSSPDASSPAQSRQIKQRLASPEDSLSYELGKAVQELPPLYTRLVAASISLLVFGAIAWAHFSRVDEVAVAQGELIPSTQVRPVRSLSGGTIQQVLVKEGAIVKKGEPLVEVEPQRTKVLEAEIARLEKSARLIDEDIARLEAERTGGSSAGTALQDEFLAARLRAFDEQQATAVAEANQQSAAISEAQARLSRLEENLINAQENLKNAREQEKGLRTLLTDSAVPRLEYIRAKDNVTNAEDKVVSLQKEIDAQRERIRQSEQAYQAASSKAEGLGSQRQSEILTQLTQRQEELAATRGQLEQSRRERERSQVEAPFDGTVYSIKATRGPVQEGEELLSILPKGEDVVLEVNVLNRDIGFIRPGQKAKVKIATFPFQEFGIVDGEVIKVSPNAIVEKDETGQSLGPVFPTRIRLNQTMINVKGQPVELTPGMAATGEIVTRQKSVLTFLIEPVTRRFNEAFSVR
jgi:HlyD family secretion protein